MVSKLIVPCKSRLPMLYLTRLLSSCRQHKGTSIYCQDVVSNNSVSHEVEVGTACALLPTTASGPRDHVTFVFNNRLSLTRCYSTVSARVKTCCPHFRFSRMGIWLKHRARKHAFRGGQMIGQKGAVFICRRTKRIYV